MILKNLDLIQQQAEKQSASQTFTMVNSLKRVNEVTESCFGNCLGEYHEVLHQQLMDTIFMQRRRKFTRYFVIFNTSSITRGGLLTYRVRRQLSQYTTPFIKQRKRYKHYLDHAHYRESLSLCNELYKLLTYLNARNVHLATTYI